MRHMTNEDLFRLYDSDLVLRLHNHKDLSDTRKMLARCRPSAPAISRLKQTTHIPMLPGFPSLTRTGARTPAKMPVTIGPQREVRNLVMKDISSFRYEISRHERPHNVGARGL